MAEIPSRLETGIAALATALAADADLSAWALRRGNDIEPEILASPEKWPAGAKCLVVLIDGDGVSLDPKREHGSPARRQEATVFADLYTRSDNPDSASTEFHLRRRRALNVVETLKAQQEYSQTGWSLDHTGWRRKGGASDRPPYTAARIAIGFNFHE